ncbi:alanine racemase [Sphingomonas sp. BN140010]|uniref:alanine racemase n=1 Tax=Sphingomonas arvum TaxID=2992113 RepID=A0ABT3JI13_9SPHN|nr:alanine racemase [Sphingomonas sp. BN140010]MCW3798631.1 alanine racemase [Sphingomonas sp. BN140010]
MHQPLKLMCSKHALASNWRSLVERAGVPAAAAVKANAYGLGAAEVVLTLAEAGCRDFLVSSWWESEGLRKVAPPGSIAVLHGIGPDDLPAAMVSDARPVLNTVEQAARWREHAGGRCCDVMIDTGMNRLGLRPDQLDHLNGLQIHTLHSHLACADEDHALNALQLTRFREVASAVQAVRYSLANSAGIYLGREFSFDLVRPGLALYGGIPRAEARGEITQVAQLQAQVVQRRTIMAGETCGYGATFHADRNTEAAIINIGYADGYWRGFSSVGSGEASGTKLPVLGRVSMDLIVLSCDALPSLAEGEWVSIDFALEQAAQRSGMSQYELLTGLGRRFNRVWH